MRARTAIVIPALLGLVLACQTARADQLYLEGGGVIEADRWWMEGDTLLYESDAGTVGIPRKLVLRIEKSEPTDRPPAVDRSPARLAEPPRPEPQRRERALELFRSGKADLERRALDSASARFLEALRADESLSPARVGYAVSEMALGRDGLALSVVLDGLNLDPGDAELLELLGDLRNREERVEDAVRSWREAFSIAPNDRLREKITKGERELRAGREYAFSTTSHFNVRYDSDVDRELATSVMDYLEEQYWELSERFRHTPGQPITVLLYPTREFRDVTQTPDEVGGVYDGKIRVPLGGLRRLDPRARGVLVHELTHAVVHSKTRGNCPRWLHEGLAQLAEGRSLDPGQRREVESLLERGDPESWESRGFSYPAALSLVRHLESRRGFYGLLDLLDLLGDGLALDDAMTRVFREDYGALCRRWAAALRDGAER